MQLERRSESDRRRSEATKGNQRQGGLAAARYHAWYRLAMIRSTCWHTTSFSGALNVANVTGRDGSRARVWAIKCLKYVAALGASESGSLATDHMMTDGWFLSRMMSSPITSRWVRSVSRTMFTLCSPTAGASPMTAIPSSSHLMAEAIRCHQ